jgi:hypothetical protein
MIRYLFLGILFPLLVLNSCNAQTGNNNSTNAPALTITATPVPNTTPKYKKVIFFALSSTELSALEKTDPSTVEATNDFDFYVNEFMANPGRTDLEILYNDQATISLRAGQEQILFERKKQAEPIGVILTDGVKAPLIKSGVFASEQFVQMCNSYFEPQGSK